MPPQQLQRLLDGVDALGGLGTHAVLLEKSRSRDDGI
jgi:hypothetical protein